MSHTSLFSRLGSLHFGAGRTKVEDDAHLVDQQGCTSSDTQPVDGATDIDSQPLAVGVHRIQVESIDGEQHEFVFSWRHLVLHMGPAFLMCIAFVDPGNLEADLQTGAQTGYSLLWVLLWSTAMGYLLQSLAARLGVATQRHLAQHCRRHYPPAARAVLWIMAELAIIGSDIQEVIGTAIALSLLSGGLIPLWAGVVVAAVSAYFLLLLEKLGVHWLERFFQVAVLLMGLSFTSMFITVDVPYLELGKGLLIPRLSTTAFPVACGLLGSIIMPHNLYLHSALVHSRVIPGDRPSSKLESIRYYNIEAMLALGVTLVINICVISVFSKGFYGREAAQGIGLENAGQYLGERFGKHMAWIWALGLLAAGQSSTMTGTYAGQFVMSGFLKLRIRASMRALVTRAVAIVPTLLVALTAGSDSTRLDSLNQWLNILQSVQLPFVIVPLLLFTSNPAIMGESYTVSKTTSTIAWGIAATIIAVNGGTAYQAVIHHLPGTLLVRAVFWAVVVGYLGFVGYLVMHPMVQRSSELDEALILGEEDEEEQDPGSS